MHKARANGKIYQNAMTFNNTTRCICVILKVDLDDDQAEMEFYHYGPWIAK